jgi:very-short-patch-repair endonuclease
MTARAGSVAALAGRQYGLITCGQLSRLGVSRSGIQHSVRVGRLHRIHVGVYAVGHPTLDDAATLLAAVMACGAEAGLSHDHAALRWELLPPWEEPALVPTNVTVPRACGRGRRPGIVVHRSALPPAEVCVLNGIPTCTAARTVLDLADAASARELERLVDQAVTNQSTTVTTLDAVAGAHPGRRGAAKLRRLIATAKRFESLTDSELEEAFLSLVRSAGLPLPALNQRLAGMRIDAIFRAERVAVELDGYRWHRSRYRQEADRRREVRLRQLGWMPLRYSAEQVFDGPLVVVADLGAVLAERTGLGA